MTAAVATPAVQAKRPRGRPATTHDNREVRRFLEKFWDVSDLRSTFRGADDILVGTLSLQTLGNTSLRGLRMKSLYHVLRWLDDITVAGAHELFRGRYEERTCRQYAEAARVASKALQTFIRKLTEADLVRLHAGTTLATMHATDADHAADAATAEALALAAGPKRGQDTLSGDTDFRSRLRSKSRSDLVTRKRL